MSERKSIHGEWSSRLAFFLAATGSAVGLGNIWGFPYIAGENGGGAFLLVYLVCVALIGLPLLIAEIALGRRGRESPVNTLRNLVRDEGRCGAWKMLGAMAMASGIIILSFYSVIAGWALDYVLLSLKGAYVGKSPDDINSLFAGLTSNPWRQMFWYTLFLVITLWIVGSGVRKGLERAIRVMMPVLFALLAALVLYSLVQGNAAAALRYLFAPDFSRLNEHVVLIAMGHSFFTLSLGVGAMMMYGAYLADEVPIVRISLWVAVTDIGVALLAGLIIFPLVFAYHLTPGQGPGLIFARLPLAFSQMPLGGAFGTAFFTLLVLAAWTSAISLLEPTVAWFEERGQRRRRAVLWVGVLVWLLGMGTDFSFNIWSGETWHGRTAFDLFSFFTSAIMLPVGGMLLAVFTGWMMSERSLRQELRIRGAGFRVWLLVLRYVTPVGVMLIFLNAMGLIRGAL